MNLFGGFTHIHISYVEVKKMSKSHHYCGCPLWGDANGGTPMQVIRYRHLWCYKCKMYIPVRITKDGNDKDHHGMLYYKCDVCKYFRCAFLASITWSHDGSTVEPLREVSTECRNTMPNVATSSCLVKRNECYGNENIYGAERISPLSHAQPIVS